MRSAVLIFFLVMALNAEEVLSSRPITIAPRRIETKTELPPEAKAKPKIKPVATRTEPDNTADNVAIDESKILLKVTFNKGSIRLSEQAQRQLLGLKLKPGQKIRIAGFGDHQRKNAERIANLRARVIASFLDEAAGGEGLAANLKWRAKPLPAYATDGAIIEAAE